MSGLPSRVGRIRAWCAHAFAIPEASPPEPEDLALIDRLADFLLARRMTTPALMVLESGRPMNFVGSQILVFLAPLATMVFSAEEYGRLTRLLERRGTVDLMIERITEAETRIHLTAKAVKRVERDRKGSRE